MDHSRTQTELEAARQALAKWRRVHGGRGRPIPAEHWAAAAGIARRHGVPETARALRLDAERLARVVVDETRSAEPVRFVELGGFAVGTRGHERTIVVELVGRDGDRVRVELAGDVGGVDVVALARAFWSRGT